MENEKDAQAALADVRANGVNALVPKKGIRNGCSQLRLQPFCSIIKLLHQSNGNGQWIYKELQQVMGQGDSERDFGTSESMKNAGILDIVLLLHTLKVLKAMPRTLMYLQFQLTFLRGRL